MSSSSSPPKLSIIVVGAGTAGLMSAVALRRKGYDVTLVERSPAPRLTGGSYRLDPNATRLFDSLGLRSELERCSRRTPGIRMRRYSSGNVIGVVDSSSGTGSRAALLQRQRTGEVLHQKGVEEGVRFIWGKKVVQVDEAKPSVTLEDGSTLMANLIVGADGANSTIRQKIFSESEPIKVLDQVSYNIFVPRKAVAWEPNIEELFDDEHTHWWVGPGGYAISGATSLEEYFVFISLEDKGLPGEGARWHQLDDLSALRERLSEWDPRVSTMLSKVNRTEYFRVVELPELPSWSSESGKVVLIGDAAHAFGPHAGLGASMGVEDAFALAEVLSTVTSTSDLRDATRLFEQFRKPRVRTVRKYNAVNWSSLTIPDGPEQQARDRNLGEQWAAPVNWAEVRADQSSRIGSLPFIKWVNAYDTIEESRKFLRDLGKIQRQSRL